MWNNHLSLRVAGPTVLMSLLLLGLCSAAAAFLYSQQATSADVLGENVTSVELLPGPRYDMSRARDSATGERARQAVTLKAS